MGEPVTFVDFNRTCQVPAYKHFILVSPGKFYLGCQMHQSFLIFKCLSPALAVESKEKPRHNAFKSTESLSTLRSKVVITFLLGISPSYQCGNSECDSCTTLFYDMF